MARKKISEFRAKTILYKSLQKNYSGISINADDSFEEKILSLSDDKKYVVKVDQGIKQRKKKGLVFINVGLQELTDKIEALKGKGFSHFLIEEFLEHELESEKYFSVERIREGKRISYSLQGGVDIEENKDSVKSLIIKSYSQIEEVANLLEINPEVFSHLLDAFDEYYFSFLEINPLVVKNNEIHFLDAAVEVDSAAEFFVNSAWSSRDFRESGVREKTHEEHEIEKLKENSPASFSYEILNPNGSILLLLSGGGASLVTADEIYQQGKGHDLINYGEYSGNPNTEETYIYTREILNTLLDSSAPKKAIIISGGVANFTDIRSTFKGVIKALDEVGDKLFRENTKVFVRRGGPHQEEGLSMMKNFLEEKNLLGVVSGPDMILTDIVTPAIRWIENNDQ